MVRTYKDDHWVSGGVRGRGEGFFGHRILKILIFLAYICQSMVKELNLPPSCHDRVKEYHADLGMKILSEITLLVNTTSIFEVVRIYKKDQRVLGGVWGRGEGFFSGIAF